jgi:hypothetical protein
MDPCASTPKHFACTNDSFALPPVPDKIDRVDKANHPAPP